MIRLYYSAALYTVLGLISGLYYRELTKAQDFVGDTQLSVVHTHLLALGMLFFLVILALEKAFTLSDSRWFTPFFWIYNAGLVLTVTMLTVHGSMTVLGASAGAAIAGMAGLGHILLTIGLVLLFLALRVRAKAIGTPRPTEHARS
jgi:hypothetical protein